MRRALAFVLPLMLVPAVASAQTICQPNAGQGGILTGLVHQFSTTTGPWANTALGYAQGLFFALVGIEIAWSAITYVLQKDSLPDFVAALLLKILSIGFFYILLQPQFGPAWIADVLSSFSQAGSAIGGMPQLAPSDPSSIFNCGTDIANAMLQSVSQNPGKINFGNLLPAIEAVLAALVCSLGVVIAFAIVAGQLLITLIESYIVIGAGVFMLGFTGSRWTLVFGEKYIGYAVSVGIKLFMLELIVGLGYGLGQQWTALFGNGIAPPETYVEVVGAALVFGFLAWQLPSLAGSLMNGAPRMTLGNFLSTASTVAMSGVVAGTGVGAVATALTASQASSTLAAADTRALEVPATATATSRFDQTTRDATDTTGYRTRTSFDDISDGVGEPFYATEEPDDAEAPESLDDDGEPADIADEAAATRASDTQVATDNERMARSAERSDVRTPPTQPSSRPLSAMRPPPIPDDSADDSISIRFHHPD